MKTRVAPNRLPDKLVARMYADYERTGSMARAAALHGRSAGTLLGIFRKRGLKTLPGRGERVARTRRARLDDVVAQMHAVYRQGKSLSAVGAMFGPRLGKDVRDLFAKRGLEVRPSRTRSSHRPDGRFERSRPHTAAEIAAIIAAETKLRVPPALKQEWRHWTLAQRGELIARLRARLARPGERPQTPFSAGLTPFEYGTPAAHVIMDALNVGRNSRCAAIKLNVCSQGVIFRDQLWFWTRKAGYVRGPWTPETGRPALHHVLWEERHGPIPPGHVVRFADNNRNNHAPDNLVLVTRNLLCRESQAAGLLSKSRAHTALLLQRSQQPRNHDLFDRLTHQTR